MADTQLHLREHGTRLPVGGNVPPSDWRRYDGDAGGDERMTTLCTDAGERTQVTGEGVQGNWLLQLLTRHVCS